MLVKEWRRLTEIINNKLEKFRLDFSRCMNCDVRSSSKDFEDDLNTSRKIGENDLKLIYLRHTCKV